LLRTCDQRISSLDCLGIGIPENSIAHTNCNFRVCGRKEELFDNCTNVTAMFSTTVLPMFKEEMNPCLFPVNNEAVPDLWGYLFDVGFFLLEFVFT
jgi:hypothetical protein